MAGLDPAIHVLLGAIRKDVDARDKRGHDGSTGFAMRRQTSSPTWACRNPEQELLKAKLTLQIYSIVKERKLTQAQAGEILGSRHGRRGRDEGGGGVNSCEGAQGTMAGHIAPRFTLRE